MIYRCLHGDDVILVQLLQQLMTDYKEGQKDGFSWRPGTKKPQSSYKKIQNYIFNFNDLLGQGNFSKVYRGHNEITNEIVAIKIIELNSLKSKKLEELLFSQIDILKKISHPNILKCHQVFTSNRNCYIITELCNEGDLQSKIRAKKYLKQQQAQPYIKHVFKGLSYLADHGIVHRDIKVSNIFINNGQAKIADFGFAKATKTKFKDINIGSPIYMSPQGYIENIYGPKTDIWAFGILIYQLLHGQTPYSHCKSQSELKYNLMIPIGWSQLKAELSTDIKEVILKCLQVDQSKRVTAAQLGNMPYFRSTLASVQSPIRFRKEMRTGYSYDHNSGPQSINNNFSHNYLKNITDNKNYTQIVNSSLPVKTQNDNNFQGKYRIKTDYEKGLFSSYDKQYKQYKGIQCTNNKEKDNNYNTNRDNNYNTNRDNNSKEKDNNNNYSAGFTRHGGNVKEDRDIFRINREKQTTTSHIRNVLQQDRHGKHAHSSSHFTNHHPHPQPTTYSKGLIVLPKSNTTTMTKSKSDAILSTSITFKQCVNILHYCRLLFKHLVIMKQMGFGDQNQRNIFKRWLSTVLKSIMKEIQERKIILEGDNISAREKKLEEVTNQYVKKYSKQLDLDFSKIKVEQSTIINYEKISNYFISVQQLIDQLATKDPSNSQMMALAHSMVMIVSSSKIMKRCYDEKNYKIVQRLKDIEDFLATKKQNLDFTSYLWYKKKYL